MSAYPTVTALLATTAMAFPHAVGEGSGKQPACTASWVLLCVVYAAAGGVVVLIRPGRAPLSDVLFAMFMGATALLNVVVAVESSSTLTPDGAAEHSSSSAVFYCASYLCTVVGMVKVAHQCFIAVWERHVFQRSQTSAPLLQSSNDRNSSIATSTRSNAGQHQVRMSQRTAQQAPSQNHAPVQPKGRSCTQLPTATQVELLERVLQLICVADCMQP
jgi:hypothetical protein